MPEITPTEAIATARSDQPPKLLDQVRSSLRVKHYSLRTERSYLHWIKRFIHFHHLRHPQDMGANEVTDFLSHLWRKGWDSNPRARFREPSDFESAPL
jgi:hypothetical protein